VSFKSVGVVGESSFTDRSHQVQSPAWAIVLITGNDVRRTSFKAEAAVNAGKQLLFFKCERR
jgi:hypothetical protein